MTDFRGNIGLNKTVREKLKAAAAVLCYPVPPLSPAPADGSPL